MSSERKGYGFSVEDKEWARGRANGHCEHGQASCERPNTNNVSHLTGCFTGRMQGTPKEWISNVSENGILLCELHEVMHDLEETTHIERVLYERPRKR